MVGGCQGRDSVKIRLGEPSLKGDDRSWFEPLIRTLARPAVRFAFMQVRDIDIAQEIVQEAFSRAWASPKTPSMEAEFRRWLYRIITNLVADYHRQRSRIPARLAPVAPADPLALVEQRAGDADLLEALQSLGLRERRAIYLRYFEDLSLADTARILGMPPITLRVIVHRSLIKLRRRLSAITNTEVAV